MFDDIYDAAIRRDETVIKASVLDQTIDTPKEVAEIPISPAAQLIIDGETEAANFLVE